MLSKKLGNNNVQKLEPLTKLVMQGTENQIPRYQLLFNMRDQFLITLEGYNSSHNLITYVNPSEKRVESKTLEEDKIFFEDFRELQESMDK